MAKGTVIEGWCDACCEPVNPGGHAAWGCVLKVNGEILWTASGYIGHGPTISNNVAEYSGVAALMREILARNLRGVCIIRGDSKLFVNQLSGSWRVRGGLYVPYYKQAQKLTNELRTRLNGNLRFEWIPREENDECDVLSKSELHKRGIVFRIQPESTLEG